MKKFKEALAQIQARVNSRIPAAMMSDSRFSKLRGYLTMAERALNALEAAQGDVNLTPAAKRDLVKVASEAAFQQVSEARKAIQEEAAKAEAAFMKAAREHSGFKANGFASELRAAFSKLDPGEKVKAIQTFITEKDGPGMAAIIDAPALLTGLSSEDRAKYSEQFFESTAPEVMATLGQYRDLTEHVLSGISTVENAASEAEKE